MVKGHPFYFASALLGLGYLHVLTMYAQSIDRSVKQDPQQLMSLRPLPSMSSRQTQQQSPSYLSSPFASLQPSRHRLTVQEARHQLKHAQDAVLPVVQDIPGNPIPQSLDEILALNVHDDAVRAQRVIYVITPTYQRLTQMVDLTRLKQTLMLASLQNHAKIYWVVLEDAKHCSQRVRSLLESSGLAFAHKAVPHDPDIKSHRGLLQRNRGLKLVLDEIGKEGVVYFADDDNGYDVQLFTELPYTRRVGLFGVGLSGGSMYERCHVNEETGLVDSILTSWRPKVLVPLKKNPNKFARPKRKYGMDMAGFAVSTTTLLVKKAKFNTKSKPGFLESDFLNQCVGEMKHLEPLAANCTRILAWHVKTELPQHSENPEKTDEEFQLMKSLV